MRFRALALGLAAVLAVSCTDQATTPTAMNDGAVAPSFGFLNGPENPGDSPVSRFEFYGPLSITDTDQGLRVRLYDTFNTFRCGGTADDPFWAYQDVDGVDRLKSINTVKEVPVVVYPWPNNPDKEFCDFLAEDWLYRGTGMARVNDNNVFWFTGTGGNNSFQTHVNATVVDPAGDAYSLNALDKVVVNGMCCFDWIPLEDEDYRVITETTWIKISP